jgi:hypothetical protein
MPDATTGHEPKEEIMPSRTEEIASKIGGAIKSAKATIEGLSGVFKELAKEHGEVGALLLRVKMTSDEQVRRDLFPQIRDELLSHETGELQEVYPIFRQHPELQQFAADHDKEAKELEQMLDELSALPVNDPSWSSRFDKLFEMVKQHVKEEENDYFPTAEKVLGKDESERMDERFLKVKNEVMQQLHAG